MKKIFYFIFITSQTILLLTSCNNKLNTVEQRQFQINSQTKYQADAKDIIKGEKTYKLIDDKWDMEVTGTKEVDGNTYVLAYIGNKDAKKLEISGLPEYKFGSFIYDNYQFEIDATSDLDITEINPYYVLKRDYKFKTYTVNNREQKELTNKETNVQTFYTTYDKDTMIPEVVYDGITNFHYYSDSKFKKQIFTFGDLYKESLIKNENTVYGVVRDDSSVAKTSDFDVEHALKEFQLDAVKNYYLTRNKKQFYTLIKDEVEVKTITTEQYIAVYSSKQDSLYVLLDKYIMLEGFNYNLKLYPRNVENIFITAEDDKSVFANNSSFKALFKHTTAKLIDLTNTSPKNIKSTSHMFSNAKNLETIIGLESIDTISVESMSYMFYKTKSLENVNIKTLDTRNVKDMAHMFDSTALTSIDVINFNTMNVEDMKYMFYNTNISAIDVENFNTRHVIDIRSMFSNIKSKITDIKLNSNLENIKYLDGFLNNSSVTNLSLINLGDKTNSYKNFFTNATIDNLDVSRSKFSAIKPLFNELIDDLKAKINTKIDISYMDFNENLNTMNFFRRIFDRFNTQTINYKNVKVSLQDADLTGLFEGCDFTKIKQDELNTWDVKNAKVFDRFFYGVYTNQTIGTKMDLKNWDMTRATSMNYFLANSVIDELDISSASKKGAVIEQALYFFTNTQKPFKKLYLENFSFVNDSFFLTSSNGTITNLNLKSLTLEGLANYLKSVQLTNKQDKVEEIVIENIDSSASRTKVSLERAFYGYTTIKKLKITNINTDRIVSLKEAFCFFAMSLSSDEIKTASYDVSNWTIKAEPEVLDMEKTFYYAFVSMLKNDNWFIGSDSSELASFKSVYGLFAGAVTYNIDTDPLFKITNIRPNGEHFLIDVPNSKIFANLNYSPGQTTKDYNKIREQVELDLTMYKYLNIDETISENYNYCYAGKIIVNNIVTEELQALNEFKVAADNKLIGEIHIDNVELSKDPKIFDYDGKYYFLQKLSSSVGIENREKLSYKNWIINSNLVSISGFFYNCPFVNEDLNTWNFKPIKRWLDLSRFFEGATIDREIFFNINRNINIQLMFFNAKIIKLPTFNNENVPNFYIYQVWRLFKFCTTFVPLDLTSYKTNQTTGNLVETFYEMKYDASVKTEDRLIDISGNENHDGWNLSRADSITDFLKPTISSEYVRYFNYNYGDIDTFLKIRSFLANQTDSSKWTYPITRINLKHFRLTGTSSLQAQGKQYLLLKDFSENVKMNLDYLHLEENGSLNAAFSNYNNIIGENTKLRGDLTVTDFSTWKFKVSNLYGTFSRRGKTTRTYKFDLSNLDLSACKKIDYIFDFSYIESLNTSNWNLEGLDGSTSDWFDQVKYFKTWTFDGMTFKKNQIFGNIWGGSKVYTGQVPDGFPKP